MFCLAVLFYLGFGKDYMLLTCFEKCCILMEHALPFSESSLTDNLNKMLVHRSRMMIVMLG